MGTALITIVCRLTSTANTSYDVEMDNENDYRAEDPYSVDTDEDVSGDDEELTCSK